MKLWLVEMKRSDFIEGEMVIGVVKADNDEEAITKFEAKTGILYDALVTISEIQSDVSIVNTKESICWKFFK